MPSKTKKGKIRAYKVIGTAWDGKWKRGPGVPKKLAEEWQRLMEKTVRELSK